MKMLMQQFQSSSGYMDVFLENMKILSGQYAAYSEKLRESNAIFLQEYPDAAKILGYE
jgi:hypothetical protein